MSRNIQQKATILQVLPSLYSGGVERGTIDISEAIAKSDMNSIVVSHGGSMVTKLVNHGAKHINLDVKTKNPFKIYFNIKHIENIIKEYNVDIVHARSRFPAWSCYFACKNLNIPFITTFHGTYGMDGIKHAYNKVMALGAKVIAPSNFIKDYITKYYPFAEQNIRLIHRGVDIEHFNPEIVPLQRIENAKINMKVANIDKKIITIPGRITKWKGHEILLEAASKLNKNKFFLCIVGDKKDHDGYFKKLVRKVADLGLTSNVAFVHHLNDMPAVYMASDIIVVPSTKPEAFGRVMAEAQAMNKIIVASNIGGANEIITDQENGFIFESENVNNLKETLEKVLDLNEDEVANITKNARKNVINNFSLTKMQDATIALYKEILAENN